MQTITGVLDDQSHCTDRAGYDEIKLSEIEYISDKTPMWLSAAGFRVLLNEAQQG